MCYTVLVRVQRRCRCTVYRIYMLFNTKNVHGLNDRTFLVVVAE